MPKRQAYNNFYKASKDFDLKGTGSNSFGRSFVEYEIYRRTDLSNLKNTKGYILAVKQRLTIPSQLSRDTGASLINSFMDYPAIIDNKIQLDVNNKATVRAIDIFPKTLNSSVTTSSSSHSDKSAAVTHQSSTGSVSTNVNTFGVSVGGGYFMGPVADVSFSYSHSWQDTTSSQNSTADTSSDASGRANDNTMSVKDWSAYSRLSSDNKTLNWLWGQSYPWDVLSYNLTHGGDNVRLPDFIIERMMSNNGMLLPPSELSMFGLDFLTHAVWSIEFPEGVTEDELATVSHTTSYYTASHKMESETFSATLQSTNEASSVNYSLGELDLSLYSLSTIDGTTAESVGVIGFMVDEFTYAPTNTKDTFKIISKTTDLQAKGTGFLPSMTSDFSSPTSVILNFKVDDVMFDYMLSLTHWVGKDSCPCILQWTVNDKYTGTLSVDKARNAEGQDNTNNISLRKLDFLSVNFHDYLVLGLNKVELKMSPDPSQKGKPCSYTLSSARIG